MKNLNLFFAAVLIAFGAIFELNAQSYPELFSTETPLELQMKFSSKQIKNETNDSTYLDSFLLYKNAEGGWDSLDIDLRARGNFRRDNCSYPPIRIKIKKKKSNETPFEGHKNLKLVMPCNSSKNAPSYIAKEYLAYKMYEEVTPYFFPTRLVKISFFDEDDKNGEESELLGFLIEDDDLVAERFGGEIFDEKKLGPTFLMDSATVRHDLFQYMIGNTDWSSMFYHNQKIMKLSDTEFIPLAYDFDMTGLVSPPYAQVSNLVDLEKITDRLYRGFCRDESLMQAVRQEFLAKENELMALVENQFFMEERDVKLAKSYLKEFFSTMSNDKQFESQILMKCRR
jgi:hypothetical protein